jgi:hypothetical protein
MEKAIRNGEIFPSGGFASRAYTDSFALFKPGGTCNIPKKAWGFSPISLRTIKNFHSCTLPILNC